VISSDSLTRELIERSGEFAINLPTVALLDAVYRCGSSSGREGDKLAAAGLTTFPASQVAAPLIEGCVGWLECRLRDEPRLRQEYDLLIADVVAAWADDAVFRDGMWRFEGQPDKRTVHHVSQGVFLASGEVVEASKA
jgi:flavin reductase (DIM6/NTAB) family NADH-FMN oxidoreductase RutF